MSSSARDNEANKSTVGSQGDQTGIHAKVGIETTKVEKSTAMQTRSPKEFKPPSQNGLTSYDAQATRDNKRANEERAVNLEKAKRQLFASSEDMAAELRNIERRRSNMNELH
ncbi:hypothetical protein SODALDRAFT_320225 [Sodiomyces alkalinus F11]|uniref:Uncharacterized protein n=1 Tax=Sodiomyces alkalinus (strain CBS 110278 / VKM F-3762 / F11) TaxID=1314773 RepID=A0A3N2PME1_SODAK|nr:hypothetical protein SODALDRAFT_320225 [Sodiomyces alkalinus F11]ROT35697.1 hypothetical protein SODALDRAFT_320225 [Sodiomyces alkalinus F11]